MSNAYLLSEFFARKRVDWEICVHNCESMTEWMTCLLVFQFIAVIPGRLVFRKVLEDYLARWLFLSRFLIVITEKKSLTSFISIVTVIMNNSRRYFPAFLNARVADFLLIASNVGARGHFDIKICACAQHWQIMNFIFYTLINMFAPALSCLPNTSHQI